MTSFTKEISPMFKVGDKVLIRSDIGHCERTGINVCYKWDDDMDEYKGTYMTITEVIEGYSCHYYHMDEDDGDGYWYEDMFEMKE